MKSDAAPPDVLHEALNDLPESLVGEIIHGQLIATPRPRLGHAYAASILGALLIPPFHFGVAGPGGWVVLSEPQLTLGDETMVPDLAGWRVERAPTDPDAVDIAVVPDWVCEILSPSTERLDRRDKLPLYRDAGVGYIWLVNPLTRQLEVYARDGDILAFTQFDLTIAPLAAPPFDAVTLDVTRLWL